MKECTTNLKELVGKKYKVLLEEGAGTRSKDHHLMVIPGQYGHVYHHASGILGAATNRRGQIAKRLSELPYVKTLQDGSDGINFCFSFEHLDEVASILKLRRRRYYSPDARRARAEHLAAVRP